MRRFGIYFAFGAALLAATGTASLAAETRGLTVKLRASESNDASIVEEVQLYSASYALVIGIDDYTNSWPRLSNAVRDAEIVAKTLRGRGFDVTLKRNLSSTEIKSVFEEFFLLKGEDPEARLFVWFAGHGHTENGEGFIVPNDAPAATAGGRFRLKALSLRRFGEYMCLAQSKHAFAVFDSCFSGAIFSTARSVPPPAITAATVEPVRQFLSSGDVGQNVSDDGTFRQLFVEALEGKRRADANRDGYLTASELGLFVSDRITNYSNRRQTPRYGKLNDPDFDRGDFVFALPQLASATTESSPQKPSGFGGGMTAETLFWQSISGSRNKEDYRQYLNQFPNGTFAGLARTRLTELTAKSASQIREPKQIAHLPVDRLNGEWKVSVDYEFGSSTECFEAVVEPLKISNGKIVGAVVHPEDVADLLGTIDATGKTVLRIEGAYMNGDGEGKFTLTHGEGTIDISIDEIGGSCEGTWSVEKAATN